MGTYQNMCCYVNIRIVTHPHKLPQFCGSVLVTGKYIGMHIPPSPSPKHTPSTPPPDTTQSPSPLLLSSHTQRDRHTVVKVAFLMHTGVHPPTLFRERTSCFSMHYALLREHINKITGNSIRDDSATRRQELADTQVVQSNLIPLGTTNSISPQMWLPEVTVITPCSPHCKNI